jgi:hypothetical protein
MVENAPLNTVPLPICKLINPDASVVLLWVSLYTEIPFIDPERIEILKLTALLATTSPLVFLKMDWKFIFCGACEKPKMGNKINNIILGYMMLDFYVLSRINAR